MGSGVNSEAAWGAAARDHGAVCWYLHEPDGAAV